MHAASDHVIAIVLSLAFVGALIEAAVCDVRHFLIPNHVPLTLIAVFVPIAVLQGFSWHDWISHAAVGVGLFAIGFALFLGNLWGGGDAKLVPAVGVWIGVPGLTRFLLVMALAGCGLSIIALLARLAPPAGAGRLEQWHRRLLESRQIPYGLAIAVAGLDWWIGAVMS